jgi:4-carboxymuconolactone decarboxylase
MPDRHVCHSASLQTSGLPHRLGLGAIVVAASLATVVAQAPVTPRVGPVPEAQRTDEQKTLVAQAPAGMTNAVATYLHYPAIAQIFVPHIRYLLNESTLPPRHRQLLALRTAWLTRSEYLWAHLAPAAREAGLTDAELRRIAQGPGTPGWDPFEASVLRAADELHVDSFISDMTWQMLATRYDVKQLIDTIDTAGALTLHAGIINSLGIPIEPKVSDRLPSGVSYGSTAKRTNIRLEGRPPRIPPVDTGGNGRGGAGGANVFRTFNRHPPADRVRGAVNTHVNSRTMTLLPRHRELLLIRIGILCRSEYEYAAHVRAGRQAGLTDADIQRILTGPDSAGDAVEGALLRATDELYENDVISPKTWAALSVTFDTRQLFDIMMAVGGYRSTSMLISSAGVQLDANMAEFRFPPALR